ncbi:MAG: IS1595 family transposase [Acidobacteria bacterium]|nr:IS1595 family transposase [Acidobacteriota bacterium]MBS1866344.1 IS1595 family transposase [Acidobacteriota bacterium]
MNKTLPMPKTLQAAMAYFSDAQRTFDYAVKFRWPSGEITCPRCEGDKHSFISTRRIWFCKSCKKQFTVKVGTIFEDSAIPMDKWMIAVWMIVNCKNGISSYEIGRALGVTQKSAWFMMHRIRLALHNKNFVRIGGSGKEIEVDETFIGGAARFMHADKRREKITDRGVKGKAAIMGILERGGKVHADVIPTRRKRDLQTRIRAHVKAESAIYTDALMSYVGLNRDYAHKTIDHAERYVDGQVHTNGLENFWSLLKRGLKGTYVNVEPFHLFRYLDEQVFRYNNRATKQHFVGDGDRFQMAMQHIANRRLTYAELTGKGTDSVHHEEAR